MMKILFAFLFVSVTTSSVGLMQGCKKETIKTPIVNPPVPVDTVIVKVKTYLALGDSYTIGQSVRESERFPYFIVQSLRQQDIKMADPVYVATTGWTTGNLLTAIANVTGTYDVVTVLIGVNDQYHGLLPANCTAF